MVTDLGTEALLTFSGTGQPVRGAPGADFLLKQYSSKTADFVYQSTSYYLMTFTTLLPVVTIKIKPHATAISNVNGIHLVVVLVTTSI